MPSIHVCSLARMEATVARSGASHLVTILDERTPLTRPPSIAADRHLHLEFNDIAEPWAGMRLPASRDIERLLGFFATWDQRQPLVVHCFAGISRSTASAFIAICALDAGRDEAKLAALIRKESPTAYPNPLMVRLADSLLGRAGRMSAAIAAMGPAQNDAESMPFSLPIRG